MRGRVINLITGATPKKMPKHLQMLGLQLHNSLKGAASADGLYIIRGALFGYLFGQTKRYI